MDWHLLDNLDNQDSLVSRDNPVSAVVLDNLDSVANQANLAADIFLLVNLVHQDSLV